MEKTDFLMALDVAFKIAAVLIALFNAFFAVTVFRINFKKDNLEKENDRRIGLLKTLILDHNLVNFYSGFDKLEKILDKLKVDQANKNLVEKEISITFIELRQKFYDSLLAIDDKLYEEIKDSIDKLQSYLSETIFDKGVNLSHGPKYDELITERLSQDKTQILKALFNYRGIKES